MGDEAEGEYPPTIVVVHARERREKCSVEPLRGQKGFQFVPYPLKRPIETTGYVRLAMSGPELSKADRAQGLLVLDASWRLADRMARDFGEVAVRSLPAWETAYPRTSKLFVDPAGGLATIEAIYVAYLLLGRDTAGLLDAYRWRDQFLSRNRQRMESI